MTFKTKNNFKKLENICITKYVRAIMCKCNTLVIVLHIINII